MIWKRFTKGWQDFWNAYNLIDKERSKFKFYATISFSFLIVGAILPIPVSLCIPFIKCHGGIYNGFINALSQIIVGTSASILAASLIEIFSAIRKIWAKEAEKDFFRFFFGSELEQESIAIVIPKFNAELISQETRSKISASEREMIQGDSQFLSFSDTVAATNIEILFENYDFRRPEVKFADERFGHWFRKMGWLQSLPRGS